MNYLVCRKQYGEGCDYTIGCGMVFDFLEASSIEDAVEKIVWPDGRNERCALEGEGALEKILIIPAEHIITVDVERMAKEVASQRALQTQEARRAKELAELRRLQEKYSG